MNKSILSKSTFIRGLQCEKSLYLYKNFYGLRDEMSLQLQAVFNQGTQVGILAQDLFPNGVDASPSSHFKMQESVYKTEKFIEDGEDVIYEATFQFNGVIAALDMLVRDDDGWKAFEVKSSTKVSEVYLYDAAIQYYTIINSGIELVDISIVHINNQYIKNGPLDVTQLFTIESVFDSVQSLVTDIPTTVQRFKGVLDKKEIPDIPIGPHCFKPYTCDFKGHCWEHVPDYSVFDISRLNINKKFELYKNGIVNFEDINRSNTSLNGNQLLQVTSELNNESHIDKAQIKGFIEGLTYPLYFLDFETMATAIPIYDNSKPYQALVFQYSLHIQTKNGSLTHKEYLAEANPFIDPREAFVERLIQDCGHNGDILVYNIGFERSKLEKLILVYPEYQEKLQGIISRLKDLMIPFQQKWYYTPEMKGSYSIKAVLPALVPELSYDELEIKEGGSASNIFAQMVLGEFEGDTERTIMALKEYCKLDTYAMVKILEKLKGIITL